ncbi:MAG: hypothetical protein IBX71_04585 [Candidatus Desulforudis sp.]|nr:hypothetical protein [Desulforudis sp.]
MNDRNRKDREPEVIVEHVPGRRGPEHCSYRTEGGPSRRCFYYHTGSRPISPFRLFVLAATGLAVLCLLLAIGGALLLMALVAGLAYTVWRRLSGRR